VKDKEEKLKKADAERMTKMLEEIANLEKQGLFDKDVDIKPPFNGKQRKTDLVNKKLMSKIKTAVGNTIAWNYYYQLMRKKQIIWKGVVGLENLEGFEGGAMVTCNHCHMFDHYATFMGLHKHFKKFKGQRRFRLWKVVEEGNFNSGGIVGYLTRHCNTLPISDNPRTIAKTMRAVDVLLKRKKTIVVFPEQALWWYYKKPRPMKSGVFMLASKFNAPLIPCFLTFKDNDKGLVAKDGQPVQEFTLHIMPMIYPDEKLTAKENSEKMRDENQRLWQQCYERVYGGACSI